MMKLMLSVDDIVHIDDYVCMLMPYWIHVFPLVFVDHVPIKSPNGPVVVAARACNLGGFHVGGRRFASCALAA